MSWAGGTISTRFQKEMFQEEKAERHDILGPIRKSRSIISAIL